MTSLPELSVIIPMHNRGDTVSYTLESVRRASVGLRVETIIVDDGSEPPAAATLAQLGFQPDVFIRQPNRGLLFARLAGLERATGRRILFLDSDDLVGPEKFKLQLEAMDRTGADVSYTDHASCTLEGSFDSLNPVPAEPVLDSTDAAVLCITVQPPPHSPIFEATCLRSAVDGACFAPSPLYNCVAEIWFYHNAAPLGGLAVKVAGPHTIIGTHSGARLTNHWERLGVASLAVMEAFARACPDTANGAKARALVGEAAFRSWRKLPRGFSPRFAARELALARRLAGATLGGTGGKWFQWLSLMGGAVNAARLLRALRNPPYSILRTMEDKDVAVLLAELPDAW